MIHGKGVKREEGNKDEKVEMSGQVDGGTFQKQNVPL